MKVLLIEPSFYLRSGELYKTTHGMAIVPLALPYIAGMLPEHWEKIIIYEKAQPVPWNEPFDLVLISALHSEAVRADLIATHFVHRGTPVILGGYYPTLSPDAAGRCASAIVVGEAEDTVPLFVADIEAGRHLKPIYHSANNHDLSHSSLPLWDKVSPSVLGMGAALSFQAARGCLRKCEFCCQRKAYGRSFRKRPVEEVVQELRVLPSRHWFQADDNPTLDRDYCKRLFAKIAQTCRPKSWILQAGAEIAEDEELLDLAAEAGVSWVCVGLETLRQTYKVKEVGSRLLYELLIKRLRERKILLGASLIFGFDGDTLETFGDTLDWLEQQGVLVVFPWILTPIIGSDLEARLSKEGRLPFGKDYYAMLEGACGTRATFTPLGMSIQELEEGFWKFLRDFYSWRSIGKRFRRGWIGYGRTAAALATNIHFRSCVQRGIHPMLSS